MARRRRSRGGSGSGVAALGLLVAFIVGARVLGWILTSPILLLPLAAGGAGLVYWRIAVRRKRHELRLIRSREIAPYLSMSAGQFEEALAFLCQRDGCTRARVTGGAGDLGADVIATTPYGHRLVIQAKRYRPGNQVTGPDLQKFGGTCYAVHRADVAAVVTTSGYTRQARQYAARMNIMLFDQQALAAWASGTGPPPWAPGIRPG